METLCCLNIVQSFDALIDMLITAPFHLVMDRLGTHRYP